MEEERMKIPDGGVWFMDSAPLYIQRWHRNFNPLITKPYKKLIWIRLNNLPMEYWTEEASNKIGRSLGTLIDIITRIAEGDSYLYDRLRQQNHPTTNRRKSAQDKKVWRPKQLIEDNQKEPIKASKKQISDIKTNMVGNGNRSPQPKVNMGEGNPARDDLIKKPQIIKENCASSMDDKVMDQVPEDVGDSEEEDGDDEIDITKIRHIEQSVSIEGRQGK
ncbi:hypothetical protein SUGI_0651360 [Cryptomeria japonica]|nr:hypothetical protein SUGI_0651360 [Cryptomeria japonica]